MDSMLNVGAWFVAVPATGIMIIVALQFIIVLTSKGAKMSFNSFYLLSLCLVTGLAWGWIIR